MAYEPEIKNRSMQLKAAIAVNSAMIEFILGRMITEIQSQTKWSDKL